MLDQNLKSDCTVEIDGDQVVVRLSKDILRRKRRLTILLYAPKPPTLKTSYTFEAKEAQQSICPSRGNDDNYKFIDLDESFVKEPPVMHDDMSLEISNKFERISARSRERLGKVRDGLQTSLVPRVVERAKSSGTPDIIRRHQSIGKFIFLKLPLEIR